MEKASRERALRFHDLRHTCAVNSLTTLTDILQLEAVVRSAGKRNKYVYKVRRKEENRLFSVGFLLGGGRWIRTTEGIASRFTVCPLWPLGNSPIFDSAPDGAGGRTRTPDLLITNQLLYRLSYTSILPASPVIGHASDP